MRRRLLILAAFLVPATAQAQTDSRETAAKARRGGAARAQDNAPPTGGQSMRGQATRPGLRAGHAYRHERERKRRSPYGE